MTETFRARIRRSLADENLQSALDANAERRMRVQVEAFASLDHSEELKKQAHAVRADVIDHLDAYLEQFATQVSKNGLLVHRAEDANEAKKIVIDIASKHGAKLIAKSKTMVSEEIGLNHELEKQGLEVIETDLGEYIVQLRGETPSHIITPAVHLRRQDVGKLFEEKLGLPYTEDISIMTSVARRNLRQVFMNADIGISGVNFGVAETGTLCVVTNEGNGRMVTTVPRTHIALMGIERIVPTLDDLALMLSLLPRSATGQKLSVYTSLLNMPRRAGDPDGPQERHLILVDNGRSLIRQSELREILYCIRCGACLNVCPVFREIGGHAYIGVSGQVCAYPGPVGSVLSPAMFGQDEFGHLARASSLCGACRESCPVTIDIPKLLLKVRAGIGVNSRKEKPKPNAPGFLNIALNFFAFAAASPRRFAMAQRLAGWLGSISALFTSGDPWIRLPAFSGWGYSKDFPRPAARSFHDRYANKIPRLGDSLENQVESSHPISTQTASPKPPLQRSEDLAAKFASELEALGGKFTSCATADVSKYILELLHRHDLHEILAWEAEFLPEGLLDELTLSGVQIRAPSAETLQQSSQIHAGLTGAVAGIAETGSLLLPGGQGRPHLASLLPEIHIAILRERDIFEHLSQVMHLDTVRLSPASVVVSGPSRTADIEMALTIGVHGPGELQVICVQGS